MLNVSDHRKTVHRKLLMRWKTPSLFETKETFKAIHNVAYVLAQPVDSYYMNRWRIGNALLYQRELPGSASC